MPRGIRSGLTLAEWPEEDRLLWQAAFETDDIFDDRDRGSHLAEATRANYLRDYGHWLTFVAEHHPDRLASRPVDRVDPEIVAEYAELTGASCRDRTVATRIERLYRVVIAFDPHGDHRWIYQLSRRIARRATDLPRRTAPSDDLAALGRDLMVQAVANADATGRISQEDAKSYRDGLMIALLAAVPVRRRTLAGLRIGEHLVRSGDGWQLDIPAELTKTGAALDYVLSRSLSASVDVFLERFRPAYSGADNHNGLWPSTHGRPMAANTILQSVTRRTEAAFGFPVSPHRFRNAAATFLTVHAPENARAAKDLLGHATFATTEKHYIAAQSRIAGRALAAAVRRLALAANASRRQTDSGDRQVQSPGG